MPDLKTSSEAHSCTPPSSDSQALDASRPETQRFSSQETSLYFPISEYEVYRIKDCMHQMGLVIDLCCMAGPDQQLSDLGGLMSFLTAQQRALRGTLQTVQARKATPGPACDPDPGD